ncbi:MAG: hypothetical protein WBD40_01485, partial [Tepidisphaeraceae bacterium]
PATQPTTLPSVLRLELIDAASGAVLRELHDGDELSATLPAAVNVLVTTNPPVVGSVRVSHNGVARLERTAPYTVGAPSMIIPAGENVIEAIAFTATDGSGAPGRAEAIRFTRNATETAPPTTAPPTTAPPTTAPSPQDHILASIDHLEAALRRLHSATQPSR